MVYLKGGVLRTAEQLNARKVGVCSSFFRADFGPQIDQELFFFNLIDTVPVSGWGGGSSIRSCLSWSVFMRPRYLRQTEWCERIEFWNF